MNTSVTVSEPSLDPDEEQARDRQKAKTQRKIKPKPKKMAVRLHADTASEE